MPPTTPARRRGRPPAAMASTGETRARILDTAAELFAQKGFHGTGVAEIGDAAGVQRGALYYHIGSKEELLWEILGAYTRLMLAAAEQVVTAGDDPISTLRELLRTHVRLIIAHRREVAIQLRDVSALTGERAAQLQQLRDRIQHCWQDVLDAGHAAGLLRTADHVVTNSVLSMANTVVLWYRPHGGRSPDEIADILTATVLHGVVTAPDTKG